MSLTTDTPRPLPWIMLVMLPRQDWAARPMGPSGNESPAGGAPGGAPPLPLGQPCCSSRASQAEALAAASRNVPGEAKAQRWQVGFHSHQLQSSGSGCLRCGRKERLPAASGKESSNQRPSTCRSLAVAEGLTPSPGASLTGGSGCALCLSGPCCK